MQLAWKVDEGSKVRLKDYDPDFVDRYTDRALAAAETEKLSEELGELQQLLAAAQHHSLLIVLQGMDTSGKDGTIRHVMAQVNPLGCEVRSFKGPTSRELARDFLKRKRLKQPSNEKETARVFRAMIRAGFGSKTIFTILKKWNVEDEVLTALEGDVE